MPTLINTHEFIDIFTLKEYFIHLFEEPADDVTWLRIKEPGTYTIHFGLIIDPNSFSFELHRRDEVILFLNTIQNIILIWRRVKTAF